MMNNNHYQWMFAIVRHYSRIRPPQPVMVEPVIRVSNNIARLDAPKEGPKPRQLLSLPPFPGHPLPGKNSTSAPGQPAHVTAISWVKYYFKGMWNSVIESHFREGLVSTHYYIIFMCFFCFSSLPRNLLVDLALFWMYYWDCFLQSINRKLKPLVCGGN